MSVLVTVAALVLSAVLTGVLFYYNLTAGIIAAVLFLCLLAATVRSYLGRNKRLKQFVEKSGAYFSTQGGKQTYPMPVVVVDEKGLLIWYNRLFEEEMVPEGTLPQDHLSQYLGKVKVQDIAEQKDGYNLAFQNRRYTVYAGCIDTEKSAYVLFFFDDTELKEAAEKYRRSKAVVLQLRIDNLEEIYKNFKNSECEVINGEVETILDEWAGNYPCLFRRISGGGFVMVTEEQSLQKMMESEFSILDKFHDYRYRGNKIAISLSIGVGRGKNLSENDLLSKQALEISQSRGGDQVTVNTDGQLSFFGGTVASTAGSSQVKARMMAATLADHMKAVDVVFTMGHAFSDLDSIGACAGVCAMAQALGKPFYVLCDKPKSMAKSLIDSLENEDGPLAGHFVDRTTALSLMRGKSTLLVVVDTHRMNSLEYPELLDGFERVAVIDHHRRVAHAMESVVFFYNEPSSSSACEMVTELIQYLPAVVNLPSRTAEALLAGIMLDTRCFVLGTGTRTFQAAAFLMSHGADTVAVKQMFSGSLDSYRIKASVLSSAEVYKNCAVAVVPKTENKELRAIASQVADELMNVTGVKASFVLFEDRDCINVSARSLGEMNVQILMEKMGGGGHFTMAATQLSKVTMEEAVCQLKAVIDSYPERAEK